VASYRKRIGAWVGRGTLAFVTLTLVYLVLLVYPQPLFAYELNHAGITVHATRPIPAAMRVTLERARARLDRAGLTEASTPSHVFICEPRWLFAVFARGNYQVGAVADGFVGRHVFVRESDMDRDRLIGPSGKPVAADRPLSYFIAHELMHIAHARALGRVGYARMPRWADDGHADYVARDIDLSAALRGFKSGARELDPARSGLYLRYHLMVAFMLQRQGMTATDLIQTGLPLEVVEHQLSALKDW
jgi:hypothetical protein